MKTRKNRHEPKLLTRLLNKLSIPTRELVLRKTIGVLRSVRSMVSLPQNLLFASDPWEALRSIGIHNFTPIRHEPKTQHVVHMEVNGEAYVVAGVKPSEKSPKFKDNCSLRGDYTPPTDEELALMEEYGLGKPPIETDTREVPVAGLWCRLPVDVVPDYWPHGEEFARYGVEVPNRAPPPPTTYCLSGTLPGCEMTPEARSRRMECAFDPMRTTRREPMKEGDGRLDESQ